MNTAPDGSHRFNNTKEFIEEINNFLHFTLNKNWAAEEWRKIETGHDFKQVHPLTVVAFKAYQQIQDFMSKDISGMTEEIFEISELAKKANVLKINAVVGLENRLKKLTSVNFEQYRSAKYEIQIAGRLLSAGYRVEFVEEGERKTPDILAFHMNEKCEVECKHKDPSADQIDYIRSIYNNTQTARKQFSKTCPGVIAIEIDNFHFQQVSKEIERLACEIIRALRSSRSISAILITSKVFSEDDADYVYRHLLKGFENSNPRCYLPEWFKSIITITN